MSKRTYLIQAATLVAAAVVLALVSNAFASRQRQMKLVGFYPNAQKVPPREEPVVATAPVAPSAPELPAVTSSQLPVATTQAPVAPVVPTATQATVNRQPVTPTAPIAPTPQIDPLKKFTPHEKDPYIEIAYNDVKLLHDHGALFLDARRTSVYEQGHIAGSRTVSVWESDVDDKVAKIFNERSDPAQQALPIVIYCSGGDCEDSHMLAQKLYGALFNNVYVYKDGFPDWQKHGGAVHTGAEP
ncbi:MAG TPA: rhodanese-like domain-containing protein [Vicinamibacterales bacterium]|nr:rhodanese-like domain-containing protein [Vicinamibacterales bacterium]